MTRSYSTPPLVTAGVFLMAGCGATAEISSRPRVALPDPNAGASWTLSVDAPLPSLREPDYGAPSDRMARIANASFDLDVTAVTLDAYARCVTAGKCTEPARPRDVQTSNVVAGPSRCTSGEPDRGTSPVTCVTVDQARAYCAWAGKRLPTGAEWTMAATGMDGDRPHGLATTPDGVMGMGGDVKEWVDGPVELRPAPSIGGAAPQQMRGTSIDIGFRCARDSGPT